MSDSKVRLPAAFWRLTASRALTTFASQMLAVVIGWSVYAQSHSALALGFVGLAEAIPALSLALWAGLLVDRGNPLQIYRRAIAANGAACAGLLFIFGLQTAVPLSARLAALYVASVFLGAARAFFQPSLYALVPRLVPSAALPHAAAWSGTVLQLARVLGPGVGGLFYGLCGLVPSLAAATLLLALGFVVLQGVAILPQAALGNATVAQASPPGALWQGLRYVRQHPIMLGALSLDMICVLFGGVTALLPVFAEQILHTGPQALGWLRAAPAMGATCGSLLLTRIDIRAHAGRALLLSVAGFGLCTLSFSLSRSLPVSLLLLFCSGALDSVSMLVRQLIVQLMSPAEMRGRISAVNAMFIGSSNELGEFESGLCAWWLGLVPSVLLGGSICMAFVAFVAVAAPQLRRLDLRQAQRQV